MEFQNNDELEVAFNQLANSWEKTHLNWQLTHIQNLPEVRQITALGKMSLPLIKERLIMNRLWYIPMEKIILNEFGDRLEVDDMEGDPEEISGGRYTHLEGHRKACLNWMEKNS